MKIKHLWNIIGLGIVIAILAVVFLAAGGNNNMATQATGQISEPREQAVISVEGVFDERTVVINPGENVLTVLEELNDVEPQLQLTVKEYTGLGVLVEGMNGKINGTDNNYWQYTVNDVMPQVGADTLKLRDGDVVRWYFSQSEF